MSNYQNFGNEWERVGERLKRRRSKRRTAMALYIAFCVSVLVIIAVAVAVGLDMFSSGRANGNVAGSEETEKTESQTVETYVYIKQPEITEDFLTPNEYSRPQTALEEVNGIVVHYTGNPNTTAKQNRDYFEDLATTHATSASSHYVVGLEGEILQCMPLDEVAYASRHRNADTISIETCHPTEDGKFTEETYEALVELVAWLLVEYDLSVEDVIRHYDVTGKECPKYFVDHESAWEDFKADIQSHIDLHSEIRTR